jgi:hypothetical protein
VPHLPEGVLALRSLETHRSLAGHSP